MIVRLLIGVAAVWFATACREVFDAAARNSASPGAIVLLFMSYAAYLIAFAAGLSIVIDLIYRLALTRRS